MLRNIITNLIIKVLLCAIMQTYSKEMIRSEGNMEVNEIAKRTEIVMNEYIDVLEKIK